MKQLLERIFKALSCQWQWHEWEAHTMEFRSNVLDVQYVSQRCFRCGVRRVAIVRGYVWRRFCAEYDALHPHLKEEFVRTPDIITWLKEENELKWDEGGDQTERTCADGSGRVVTQEECMLCNEQTRGARRRRGLYGPDVEFDLCHSPIERQYIEWPESSPVPAHRPAKP